MLKQIPKKIIAAVFFCVVLLCLSCMTVSAAEQGDVDLNGRINAADARLALRISAKIEKADDDTYLRADVDLNGRVTSADARLILRVSAGVGSFPEKEYPIVGTTTEPCISEDTTDGLFGGDSQDCPTRPAVAEPTTSESLTSEIINMEDILGSAIGKYTEKFSLVQCYNGQRTLYEGDDILVTVFGSAHTAFNVIESVVTSRQDISVAGMTVGLTVGQTENHLHDAEYYIETVNDRYSCLYFNYEDYLIQVMFDDGVVCKLSGGKEKPVNYSVDTLIDKSPEDAFSTYANNCNVTENDDGSVTYDYIGLTATVRMKHYGMVVDEIVLEGESDYNIGNVYIGMNISSLYDAARYSDFTVSGGGDGTCFLTHSLYSAEVITSDNVITRIHLLSNTRPYEPGKAEDLSFILGKDISEISVITDKEPVIAENDSNTRFYDAFYLTTEGCLSETPDRVCLVSVCADGYGFAGIEFGMPVSMLTEFLDGKDVDYLYDEDSAIIKIASGEYGDYSFRITVNNGFIDWIEVSTGTFDSVYVLNLLLMTTIDTSSGPFAYPDKTEDNGNVILTHDCTDFILTEKEGRYVLTGAVMKSKCDFSVFGFTVGDETAMIEAELLHNGFSQFEIINGGFTATNSVCEIRVYEKDGIAERIELFVL